MVDWPWFYNPCHKYFVGYVKPKKANKKWVEHLFENKMCSHIEVVGICCLILDSGFVLELKKIFLYS